MNYINLINAFDREIEVLEVTEDAMIYAVDRKDDSKNRCDIEKLDFNLKKGVSPQDSKKHCDPLARRDTLSPKSILTKPKRDCRNLQQSLWHHSPNRSFNLPKKLLRFW